MNYFRFDVNDLWSDWASNGYVRRNNVKSNCIKVDYYMFAYIESFAIANINKISWNDCVYSLAHEPYKFSI